MSKQVRIRRGTTAQHATFTGADGEVTFDTTKKCLVLHDGVTPGGKPVEGFLKLTQGNPVLIQTIDSVVSFEGGDSETYGVQVTRDFAVFGTLYGFGECAFDRPVYSLFGLTYSASIVLDFATPSSRMLDLTGNVSFSTANLGSGRTKFIRIKGDGSARNYTFPASWVFLSAVPASLAANKTAFLKLTCFGNTDADVVAEYAVQP